MRELFYRTKTYNHRNVLEFVSVMKINSILFFHRGTEFDTSFDKIYGLSRHFLEQYVYFSMILFRQLIMQHDNFLFIHVTFFAKRKYRKISLLIINFYFRQLIFYVLKYILYKIDKNSHHIRKMMRYISKYNNSFSEYIYYILKKKLMKKFKRVVETEIRHYKSSLYKVPVQ